MTAANDNTRTDAARTWVNDNVPDRIADALYAAFVRAKSR